MQADELEGELFYECWKGWNHYGEGRLPDAELLAVIRQMLRNRVNELYVAHHKTHRKHAQTVLDITELEHAIGGEDAITLVESYERFAQWLRELTPAEFDVVQAILGPDERVYAQLKLAHWRKEWVYARGKVKVTPELMAEALHVPLPDMRVTWEGITKKWRARYE
jgi:hypothetical protein